MVGVKRNARMPGEIIVSTTLPIVSGWQGYSKVGVRNAMVISVASCCLVVDRINGTIAVALGAVGPTIIRCRETESWLAAQVDLKAKTTVSPNLLQEFGDRIATESKPIDDHRSTAAYRRHAVAVLARRMLTRANAQLTPIQKFIVSPSMARHTKCVIRGLAKVCFMSCANVLTCQARKALASKANVAAAP